MTTCSRERQDAIEFIAHNAKFGWATVTSRRMSKKMMMSLLSEGLVKSIGLVRIVDGDGFATEPERYREGFMFTDRGEEEAARIAEAPKAYNGYIDGCPRRWDPVETRLWLMVDKDGPVHPVLGTKCWIWKGSHKRGGYGRLRDGHRKNLSAHRVAWEVTNGPISNDLHVCHHCDNRACCNPEHLFLGTPKQNALDRDAKGRGPTKMTDAGVRELRALRSQGKTYVQLSAMYGISQAAVYSIIKRHTWRHVD